MDLKGKAYTKYEISQRKANHCMISLIKRNLKTKPITELTDRVVAAKVRVKDRERNG